MGWPKAGVGCFRGTFKIASRFRMAIFGVVCLIAGYAGCQPAKHHQLLCHCLLCQVVPSRPRRLSSTILLFIVVISCFPIPVPRPRLRPVLLVHHVLQVRRAIHPWRSPRMRIFPTNFTTSRVTQAASLRNTSDHLVVPSCS